MMADTLVVTSALNPVTDAPKVSVVEPQVRLSQLCCSLLSWAKESAIQKVVLCDNSSPEYDFRYFQQIFEDSNKSFEVLSFQGDRSKVAAKGKGYGEGEIMRYALEHSQLLVQSQSFYKVTGRVYISNFSRLHQMHRRQRRVFDNPIPALRRYAKRYAISLQDDSRHKIGRVNTVFYKCNKQFFLDRLLTRNDLVNDRDRFTLEHAYFEPLIRYGFSTFETRPSIVGVSGTTGRFYQAGEDYPTAIKLRAAALADKLTSQV